MASADDITAAVLAHEDVARYVSGAESDPDARARLDTYLDELRTTQRYRFYKALRHPLHAILRNVDLITEHVEHITAATRTGHVVYVSNHKSHLDYLIQLLVLDNHGFRPPLIAAGINMFGGPLGLIWRHVAGAIPIRRGNKDPVYLATLKAFITETLKKHDLLYYAEGGRSYTGALMTPKTGLLQAALQADRSSLSIVPVAIAYDLVLEDRMLARQAVTRRKKAFSHELTELMRRSVGYHTRAYTTFGAAIPLSEFDPSSRRDLVSLAHRVHHDIGQLHKVLPTALIAVAMRPSITRSELAARIDDVLETLASRHANLSVASGRQAVDDGLSRFTDRGVLVVERQRIRVRERTVIRYYARTLKHLLT